MRIAPLYVKFVMDEDGKPVLKDGQVINICPVCSKETVDVVEVYHGNCHKNNK